MKSIVFVLVAGITYSHAFQPVAFNLNSMHQTSALRFYPEQFDRARECATNYGTCDLEELEYLADQLEAFQSSEDGGGFRIEIAMLIRSRLLECCVLRAI